MTDTIARMARPVPRYTSYPTAPHFDESVDAARYERWLEAVAPDASLSLYLHLPFCRALCWYCGCETRAVRRYDPVRAYLKGLEREIDLVAARLGGGRVTHIHWGGGTPSLLAPDDVRRLADRIASRFSEAAGVELAVEFDPRGLTDQAVATWLEAGLTRASIGVQDVNPGVQAAIGREQPFDLTRSATARLRDGGVGSIGVDLIYGLPTQTARDVVRSVEAVAGLGVDRVALFGYAHVPWMRRHQRLIDASALPDAVARMAQAGAARDALLARGYVAIGLDHFARPDDPMAQRAADGSLRRNFQGYTTDAADALIGLGASSIGRLPAGYVQNERATGRYLASLREGRLPIARGRGLTLDDRIRGHVIERLLCGFRFDALELMDLFGEPSRGVIEEARRLARGEADLGLSEADGVFTVAPAARPFVRTLASRFDAYLGRGPGRHSMGV